MDIKEAIKSNLKYQKKNRKIKYTKPDYFKVIEEFIEKARELHRDRYDYSKFNYINCKTKGIIICKEHGEFSQHASNHLLGKGCSKCAGCYKYTTIEFIEKAKKTEWGKKTLFIITSDHTQKLETQKFSNSIGKFWVPLVFIHPSKKWTQDFKQKGLEKFELKQSVALVYTYLCILKMHACMQKK